MRRYARRLSVLVLIAFMFCITGCDLFAPPKNTVESFMAAVEKGDLTSAAQYVVPNGNLQGTIDKSNDPESEKMIKAIFTKVSHKIVSTTKTGDKAQVTTSITSPDLLRITSTVMGQMMPLAFAAAFSEDSSQDNMDQLVEQYMMNAITDPNAPMTTTEVVINLTKQNGKWLIVADDNLVNAMAGNIGKLSALGE